MSQTDTSTPRVFGRQLARELTTGEVDQVTGAGDGGTDETGFTTADLCADGVITDPSCGDQQSDVN